MRKLFVVVSRRADLTSTMALTLSQIGCHVVCATNEHEIETALQAFAEAGHDNTRPDAVVIDASDPELGFNQLDTIRAWYRARFSGPQLRVILLFGRFNNDEDADRLERRALAQRVLWVWNDEMRALRDAAQRLFGSR